jgi:hypothetical protein
MGPGGKDAAQPQVRIIEHADVKRMLLAQKSTAKARWRWSCIAPAWWTSSTRPSPQAAGRRRLLLEVLTPIAKSWPSEWCLEANSLAIQVHGGYGYTRDFPVEQYWRDNRLNMIHEGTHGIQAMDLLGRKVVMEGGKGLQAAGRHASTPPLIARPGAPPGRACQRAGKRAAAAGRGHQGRLVHRRPAGRAGQCRALHAGLWPHGAGLDLAGRGAGHAQQMHPNGRLVQGAAVLQLLPPLRAAQDRGLAGNVVAARDQTCAEHAGGRVLMASERRTIAPVEPWSGC